MPSTPSAPHPGDLPRQFASRDALEALLAQEFPSSEGPLSPIHGGRQAAEARLAKLQPSRYAKSRNHLKGAVTGLSPFIRHGVLTLVEVRDAVFQRIRKRDDGSKLINELGWRDFWQRMWLDLGDGIHEDQEAFKTGHDASSYALELPEDVRRPHRTGCADGFRNELVTTGWLYNHARMWMAAGWCTGVGDEAGADGSRTLGRRSRQQPPQLAVGRQQLQLQAFFNRGNLERYTMAAITIRPSASRAFEEA